MLESNLFRNGKAKAGEMKFESMPAWRNLQRSAWTLRLWQGPPIDDHFFDHHRRRQLIFFDICGVDNYQPLAGSEPESPIGGFTSRRLQSTRAFKRGKALTFPVSQAVHPVGPSISAGV